MNSETERLADWILNRLPATGGDVDFTRLELETRITAALTAEREKYKIADDSNEPDEITRLREQLAAERERYEQLSGVWDEHLRAWGNESKQLREQLAAAVVAIKRMQGAAMDENLTEVQQIGDAALAKLETK